MSRIKKMVKSRLNELALIELQAQAVEPPKPELVAASVRLYLETIKNLDLVAEKLELTRSDVIREFLDVGVREALVELNVDPLEWNNSEDAEIEGDINE